MSSEKELTPEEKLLALIQQDKRQGSAPEPAKPVKAPASAPASSFPLGSPPALNAESRAETPVPSVPAAVQAPATSPAQEGAVGTNAGQKLRLAPTVAPAPQVKAEVPSGGPLASAETPEPPTADVPASPPAEPSPVRSRAPRFLSGAASGWSLVNRGLALVVLVLVVVVVYSIASIPTDVENAMARQVEGEGSLSDGARATVEVARTVPVDEYLQKVSGRDVFQTVEPGGTTTNLPGAVQEFKLMGVSIDTNAPDSSMAILRSKTTSRTYFVKPGEALGDTGFTLGRVMADRAILKKQQQEIEVR